MQRIPDTMAVFAVEDEIAEVSASVESGRRVKNVRRRKRPVSPEQRVGTAYTLSDGSIGIRLTAMPRNGKLVVRASRARGSGASLR